MSRLLCLTKKIYVIHLFKIGYKTASHIPCGYDKWLWIWIKSQKNKMPMSCNIPFEELFPVASHILCKPNLEKRGSINLKLMHHRIFLRLIFHLHHIWIEKNFHFRFHNIFVSNIVHLFTWDLLTFLCLITMYCQSQLFLMITFFRPAK